MPKTAAKKSSNKKPVALPAPVYLGSLPNLHTFRIINRKTVYKVLTPPLSKTNPHIGNQLVIDTETLVPDYFPSDLVVIRAHC